MVLEVMLGCYCGLEDMLMIAAYTRADKHSTFLHSVFSFGKANKDKTLNKAFVYQLLLLPQMHVHCFRVEKSKA